jgi:hypothetical protein
MSGYKFPDELDGDEGKDVELHPVETSSKEAKQKIEVEIEDDTPVEDRGRRPMQEPPEEVTDDELSTYDEKVQARIKKFTRGYHDERRAKEEAFREREAAEQFARQVYEENRRLQEQLASGSQMYVEQAKSVAEIELDSAKKKYKEAYEAGDPDLLAEAQAEISRATLKLDKAENMRPLQVREKEVQLPQNSNLAPNLSDRDKEWFSENPWFGPDDEMTSTALGVHRKLVKEHGEQFVGTTKYYKQVDAIMRRRYPDYFGSDETPDEDTPPRRAQKPANVVAPATRSTPPDRVKLKASEVNTAKRLGVPLELYAQKVAELRKGE